MLIYFNKYEGAGNDFIIIDNRTGVFPPSDEALIRQLCDRHFGIGADGLILIENEKGYDFRMLYFNSDGRPGSMCGNGGRCAAAFAYRHKIAGSSCTFLASDGIHRASKINNMLVELTMGNVNPPMEILGNHFLDTGSPHYIIPVSEVESIDVENRGRNIREATQFNPGGTNVNFVESDGDSIKIRTYERGVEGETLACGTGVTAAAISSRWNEGPGQYSVNVETRGGSLRVDFRITDRGAESVILSGPATYVFSGEIEI